MKKPPCEKNCPDRCPGCHDRCEKYAEWKKELERAKAFVRGQNATPVNEKAKRAGWRKMRYGSQRRAGSAKEV